jgi:hypothetical protein
MRTRKQPAAATVQPCNHANAPHREQEVKAALDYGQKLARLAGEEDLVPGVALPTLRGGEWEGEARRRDARELFRAYCEETVTKEVGDLMGGTWWRRSWTSGWVGGAHEAR